MNRIFFKLYSSKGVSGILNSYQIILLKVCLFWTKYSDISIPASLHMLKITHSLLNSEFISCCVFIISFLWAAYSMHEPIIPRGARQGPSQLKRTCSIFAYEDIKEVHKRRYLLQVGWFSSNKCFVRFLYLEDVYMIGSTLFLRVLDLVVW